MTAAAVSRDDWGPFAACRGQDTDAWYPQGAPPQFVLEICRRCPVRVECLYDALVTETKYDRYGVRGGLSAAQRRALPAVTGPRAQVLPVLRELLARDDQANPLPSERNPMPQPAPATPPAEPVAAVPTDRPEPLPEEELLAWADTHVDPAVQDQAARARVLMTSLRTRHATDRELNEITSKEEKLAAQLADLRTRKATLLPKKTKKSTGVDYPAAEVRAWAEANGYTVSPTGRIAKPVVDAWRTATGHNAGAS